MNMHIFQGNVIIADMKSTEIPTGDKVTGSTENCSLLSTLMIEMLNSC